MTSEKLWTVDDVFHMRSAIALSRHGLGKTWPNPSVGCVIVREGRVIARARTADGGRPHAETQAIQQAGDQARGAVMYVTLEPCSHHGQTPPCVDAIIKTGISRIVIAIKDPDSRVNGSGITLLKSAGLRVDVGLLDNEASEVLKGYCLNKISGRPKITLKIASSLDGKVALPSGESQWITGDLSRKRAHLERSQNDAIMVGIGTITADNPLLNNRSHGASHDPVRVVIDTHLRIPMDAAILDVSTGGDVWIMTNQSEGVDKFSSHKNVEVVRVPESDHMGIKLSPCLEILAKKGISSVLVEGGPTLVTSFLKEGLFDRILWFRAPSLLGEAAVSGVGDLEITDLEQKLSLKLTESVVLGQDRLDILEKAD